MYWLAKFGCHVKRNLDITLVLLLVFPGLCLYSFLFEINITTVIQWHGSPPCYFNDVLLCSGMWVGFCVAYWRASESGSIMKSAKRNMVSTYEHPSVVADYLEKECSEDWVMGPFSLEFSRLHQIHIS